MNKQIWAACLCLCLLNSASLAFRAQAAEFGAAKLRLEQNATDGDLELVIEVLGGNEGLVKLTVATPKGGTIVDFSAPPNAKMGMREFVMESPEPKDAKSLLDAYPEGEYKFAATSASGEQYQGSAKLSHKLPGTAVLQWKEADDPTVELKNPKITWKSPAERVKGYIVEVEQGELGVTLKTELPASATSFTLPAGMAVADMDYDLGIGTVSENGNVSFVETEFSVVGKD